MKKFFVIFMVLFAAGFAFAQEQEEDEVAPLDMSVQVDRKSVV